MGEHSTLVGGSSAARVMNCPGSVKLAQKIKTKDEGNVYTWHGSAMHYIMEQYLLTDEPEMFDPERYVGRSLENHTVTEDDITDCIDPAIDATEDLLEQYNVQWVEAEAKLEFTSIPGAFGTSDVVAKTDCGGLLVADFKFGSGNLVSPVRNSQLMFYAAGVLEDEKFKDEFRNLPPHAKVVLAIIQPPNEESPLSVWETTKKDIATFQAELVIAASEALQPDAPLAVGGHCRWCPAHAICPLKADKAKSALRLDAGDKATLAEALTLADDLEPWIRAVRGKAKEQLELGAKIEGWKLVNSRPSRKWEDEDEMLETLRRSRKFKQDEYTVSKMVTPPQFEKLCKQKGVDYTEFADYVIKVSSGTTLAHDTDPRPAVVVEGDKEIPEHLAKAMREEKPAA